MSNRPPFGFCLSDWKRGYESGELHHDDLLDWVSSFDASDPAWISVAEPSVVRAQLERLPERRRVLGVARLPLDGVPFAIKDNIDAAGWVTTAACPAFSRLASEDALIVARLCDAGAILVGKTNLDQFATGLVGTRSPYGAVPSSLDGTRIGGGSSSGSAAVVAKGLVPFALGTDTAGSGRVPAAFQNVVGYKPTRGRFSTRGLVPACRTLDCPSIFALTVGDAAEVAAILDHFDPFDPFSRRPQAVGPLVEPRLVVPAELEFYGDELAERAFDGARAALREIGFETKPIDFRPFRQLADLLYAASWVAERSLVAGPLLDAPTGTMDPTVHAILRDGRKRTAEEAFAAEYRRAELARQIDLTFERADVLVVPTTPTVYRLGEVAAEPIVTNARLGTYTNFTNLGDLCALAIPGPFRDDRFPAGITLLARAFHERWLVDLARRLEAHLDLPLGATGRRLPEDSAEPGALPTPTADVLVLAVVGAHLSGMPLSPQLTSRGATLIAPRRTAARYELRLLAGSGPQRPGLFRSAPDDGVGAAIEVELWALPKDQVGSFLELVPPPLGLGSIELDDGQWVRGFICEPWGRRDSVDITHFGGFRAFVAARS